MRGRSLVAVALLSAASAYGVALWLQRAAPERAAPDRDVLVAENPAPRSPLPAEPTSTARSPQIRRALRRVTIWLQERRRRLEVRALQARGWRHFAHEIPEDISYRSHDFLHEVEAACVRGWFVPQARESYESAMRAWDATRKHVARLASDRSFRAAENVLANLAHSPRYKGLHLRAVRDTPFLHVFVSAEPLSIWSLRPAQRDRQARKKIALRVRHADRVLRRGAAVHRAVHDNLVTRFGKGLRLADLSAAYGGRPDMPYGVRSFPDGVVLVSVTPADRGVQRRIDRTVHGWSHAGGMSFDGGSGFVRAQPVEAKDVAPAVWPARRGRLAAWQILFWYTRQRVRWRKPRPDAEFATYGLATWLGACRFAASGRCVWTGVNGAAVEDMHDLDRQWRGQGGYIMFPVQTLLKQSWMTLPPSVTASVPGTHSLAQHTFVCQQWALAHFLARKGGGYEAGLVHLLDAVLSRETGGAMTLTAFEAAYRDGGSDFWDAIDVAFERHVRERLIKKIDVNAHLPKVPPLSAWDK